MNNISMPSMPNVYFKAPYERAYHLIGAGRLEKRKFLCVTNKWEKLLFKYKGCSEKHLHSYIVDSLFYMSDRSQLNDPFDVKSLIDFAGGGINRQDYLNHLSTQFKMSRAKQREVKERLNSSRKIEKMIRLNLQNEISATGVHSFATSARNLLMWAHYANSHRGVCLIFDVCEDVDTFVAALPVTYSQTYPVIKYHIDIGPELVKKSFLTKSSEWSYESERRIFDRGFAKQYLAFNSNALLGIVLGANISEADKIMIYSLLAKRRSKGLSELKVFQARCSDSEYKLKIWRA
jgi:hypothetical protein